MSEKLLQAIRDSDIETFSWLLKNSFRDTIDHNSYNKININFQDKKTGNTALHIAVIYNNMNMLDQLLDQGADLTIKNNKGLDANLLYQILYLGG